VNAVQLSLHDINFVSTNGKRTVRASSTKKGPIMVIQDIFIISTPQTLKDRNNEKQKLIHTVNHRGRNPKTDGRDARNIEDRARATFCFTCRYIYLKINKSKSRKHQMKMRPMLASTSEVVCRDLEIQNGTPEIVSCSNNTSATAIAVALARCASTIPTVAAARAGASLIPSPTMIKPRPKFPKHSKLYNLRVKKKRQKQKRQ
jgi:hypothetical protein